MKRLALALTLLVGGCSILPNGDDPEDPKAACDQFASQAIQTDDLTRAKNLAARAAECYAAAQNR